LIDAAIDFMESHLAACMATYVQIIISTKSLSAGFLWGGRTRS
jgi:hypothetical protein